MMTNVNEIQINFDSLLKQGLAVVDVRFKDYEISDEKFKYVIVRVDGARDDFYPRMLKHYLGLDIKEKNIYNLWIEILNHKLQMSLMLNRDISIKVAAMDYYETNSGKVNP
jgi:hypothetical protein